MFNKKLFLIIIYNTLNIIVNMAMILLVICAITILFIFHNQLILG